VRLWKASSYRCIRILQGDTEQLSSIAFSPDGNMLASTGWNIQLLELNSGRCLHKLLGHTLRVRSAAFSPNGSILASGSEDGTIKIWDTQKGKCLKTLTIDRPYERMNITGLTGLTEAQKAALRALGAFEDEGKEFIFKAT
jgi:WD40 repeat protein